MNKYKKIIGLLTEEPRRIPRGGFSSVHQPDPRGKKDPEMRRSYAARQDHTYVEMLNRGLAMAKRKLDRGEGSQEVVDMWLKRLKANQKANPGGGQSKSIGESKRPPVGREESRMYGRSARKHYAKHKKLFSKAIRRGVSGTSYGQEIASELMDKAKKQFDKGIRKTLKGSRAVKDK
jgi:hypothetical protein